MVNGNRQRRAEIEQESSDVTSAIEPEYLIECLPVLTGQGERAREEKKRRVRKTPTRKALLIRP